MIRIIKNLLVPILLVLIINPNVVEAQITPEQDVIMSVDRIWDRAEHNAFPGLIEYNNKFYCSFREGTAHVFGVNGSVRVIASDDGQNWYSVAHLFRENVDLRDPKLSITPDNRIMINIGGSIYVGKDLVRMEPLVSFSDNAGINFSAPQNIGIDEKIRTEKDWLWRATWHKGMAYGAVYQALGLESKLQLVRSRDGINYEFVKNFDLVGRPNETTLRFSEDDQMIAIVRRESESTHGFIGNSEPPYTQWNWQELDARLGGPDLLILPDGHMITGTRDYPADFNEKMILAKVTKEGNFRKLVTLPSGGDCSYPGLLIKENILYVAYYSSHEERTSMYLARIWLDRLKNWIAMEESASPSVNSDKNGLVRLNIPDGAKIRYTLDGTIPTETHGYSYMKTFNVTKTTPLRIRAFESGKFGSKMISTVVGSDIFQDAQKVEHELKPGLRYAYFEGETSRVKGIDGLVPASSGVLPNISINEARLKENIAFRFEGFLSIPKDGLYTFFLVSNDGSQLKLNNDIFIDNDGPHGEREVSSVTSLRKGYHKIELNYFQLGGGKILNLFWQGPGFEREEIPASVLYH